MESSKDLLHTTVTPTETVFSSSFSLNSTHPTLSSISSTKDTSHLFLANKIRKLMSKQKEKRSPFAGSVNRSHHEFSKMFRTNALEVLKDFFVDNYSSNFTSNFRNPMTRIVFVKSQQINKDVKPLSSAEIQSLFITTMNEVYCKAIEGDSSFEYPTCLLCLKDIAKGSNSTIINCGHIFHSSCISSSLKQHGMCPVCQYDLLERDCVRLSHIKEESVESRKGNDKKEEFSAIKRAISTPLCFMRNKLLKTENINIYGEQEAIIF